SKHGHVSTLIGRLLPVIRQYISLPAGIARMPMKTFMLFTTIGAGSWVCVLTFAGYLLGEHQDLLKEYLHVITLSCVAIALIIGVGYYLFFIKRRKKL
ncbi:MAG: VTT domain-containing protein, partial [Synergistaceae bacterium]|nr:VTT domain-containing protein [Synergistaceae bacterium]